MRTIRTLVVAIALLGMPLAAHAGDISPMQQFANLDSQSGGAFDNLSYGDYSPKLTQAIVGRWFYYQGPVDDVAKGDQQMANLCPRLAWNIRSDDPYSFSITRGAGSELESTTTYTNVGYMRFAMSFDVKQQLHALGLDKSDTPLENQIRTLGYLAGFANVALLSKDVLVIWGDTTPRVFLRCPK